MLPILIFPFCAVSIFICFGYFQYEPLQSFVMDVELYLIIIILFYLTLYISARQREESSVYQRPILHKFSRTISSLMTDRILIQLCYYFTSMFFRMSFRVCCIQYTMLNKYRIFFNLRYFDYKLGPWS